MKPLTENLQLRRGCEYGTGWRGNKLTLKQKEFQSQKAAQLLHVEKPKRLLVKGKQPNLTAIKYRSVWLSQYTEKQTAEHQIYQTGKD